MRTGTFRRLAAVALVATAWGCELGSPEGVGEEAVSGSPAVESTPEALAEAVLAPGPAPLTPGTEGAAEEPGTDGSAQVPASTVADCISFVSGSARLVPCTNRLSTTNWAGHDDPDPWRPAEVPANPF